MNILLIYYCTLIVLITVLIQFVWHEYPKHLDHEIISTKPLGSECDTPWPQNTFDAPSMLGAKKAGCCGGKYPPKWWVCWSKDGRNGSWVGGKSSKIEFNCGNSLGDSMYLETWWVRWFMNIGLHTWWFSLVSGFSSVGNDCYPTKNVEGFRRAMERWLLTVFSPWIDKYHEFRQSICINAFKTLADDSRW